MPLTPVEEIKYPGFLSYTSLLRPKISKKYEADLNTWVDEINELIDAYNAPGNASRQLEYLTLIKAKIKAMDDAQNSDILVHFPGYFEKIQTQLFREIQAEEHRLAATLDIQPNTSPLTLTELIAEMDPDKINQFAFILSRGTGEALTDALYDVYQPGEAGKEKYDAFLRAHTITVLGGGNSKNFKVVKKDTDEAQVLKLDGRIDTSKEAEAQLRDSAASDVFTPIFADRRIRYFYGNENARSVYSTTLQVTAFCPGGDLENHGLSWEKNHSKIISAALVYSRMAEALEHIQSEGFFFPDMKNTNWLVDSNNQPRIADGKSFVMFEEGELPDCELTTSHFAAPEMLLDSEEPFSADKAHAYMLAKNLYQYLSGCDYKAFYEDRNIAGGKIILEAGKLDFSQDIFETDEGRQFKQLIEDGMKLSAADRPSLTEMKTRIQAISSQLGQQAVAAHQEASIAKFKAFKEKASSVRADSSSAPQNDMDASGKPSGPTL